MKRIILFIFMVVVVLFYVGHYYVPSVDMSFDEGDSLEDSVSSDGVDGAVRHFVLDPVYFVQIDAQYVVNAGADAVISDLKAGGVNTVALQMFSDGDFGGVYWDSGIAPVRMDILSDFVDVAHDNDVDVFVWMTTLDMFWIYDELPELRVKAYVDGAITEDTGWYRRVSPASIEHRDYIVDIFHEIVANYDIDGVLLQDDLYLGSDEVFDAYMKKAYRDYAGRELDSEVIRRPAFHEWKAGFLTEIVKAVNDDIKVIDPDVKLVVNVYAGCALDEDWCLSSFGQDYRWLAMNSDYMAIMAYPVMNGEKPSWVGDVAKSALILESDAKETIIKVQVVDWDTGEDVDRDEVLEALRFAKRAGARNLGFYLSGRTMSELGLDFSEIR